MKLKHLIPPRLYEDNHTDSNLLKSPNGRYIILPYNEDDMVDYDEYEKYNIEPDEMYSDAIAIVRKVGVNILRGKTLSGILFDTQTLTAIGGVWVETDGDVFSFDIAIDTPYQGKGLSDMLIQSAISDYEYMRDANDDLRMELDVINPKMARILKSKYGFYVTDTISGDRVIMNRDETH